MIPFYPRDIECSYLLSCNSVKIFKKLVQTEWPILGAWKGTVYSYVDWSVLMSFCWPRFLRKNSRLPCFVCVCGRGEWSYKAETTFKTCPKLLTLNSFLNDKWQNKYNWEHHLEMYYCRLMTVIFLSDCHSRSLLNTGTLTGCSCPYFWKHKEQFRFSKVTFIFYFLWVFHRLNPGHLTCWSVTLPVSCIPPRGEVTFQVSITLSIKSSGGAFC